MIPPPKAALGALLLLAAAAQNALPCIGCGKLAHIVAGDAVALALEPAGGHALSQPAPRAAGNLSVSLLADEVVTSNAAVMEAFDRAVAQWSRRIASPITLTIEVDFAPLGETTIGLASSVFLQGGYDLIRDQLAASAGAAGGPAATLALPSSEEFLAVLPDGFELNGLIVATKANLKAMGFDWLDDTFGALDGSITLSSEFAFDLDNRDGVGPGLIDFESVVAHEIGHMLGFVSIVDEINAAYDPDRLDPLSIPLTPFDLFRFADPGGGAFPGSLVDFASTPRNLIPGLAATLYMSPSAFWNLSTGLANPFFPGTDGRQSSHWLDQTLSGNFVGVMNPTIGPGEIWSISEADLAALALVGWQIAPVPEPAAAAVLAALVLAVARRRYSAGRRRRTASMRLDSPCRHL